MYLLILVSVDTSPLAVSRKSPEAGKLALKRGSRRLPALEVHPAPTWLRILTGVLDAASSCKGICPSNSMFRPNCEDRIGTDGADIT
jgi:hypothetical protein